MAPRSTVVDIASGRRAEPAIEPMTGAELLEHLEDLVALASIEGYESFAWLLAEAHRIMRTHPEFYLVVEPLPASLRDS